MQNFISSELYDPNLSSLIKSYYNPLFLKLRGAVKQANRRLTEDETMKILDELVELLTENEDFITYMAHVIDTEYVLRNMFEPSDELERVIEIEGIIENQELQLYTNIIQQFMTRILFRPKRVFNILSDEDYMNMYGIFDEFLNKLYKDTNMTRMDRIAAQAAGYSQKYPELIPK